jgi:hypothetical protein
VKRAFVSRLGIILSGITLLAWAAPGATIARAQPSSTATAALYAATPRVSGLVSSQVGTFEGARNAALTYIQRRYPVNKPPAATAPWMAGGYEGSPAEQRTGYIYLDWSVIVSYPNVPAPTYSVIVTNDPLGFSWVGEVTTAGRVTTLSVQNPVGAWNSVYNHVRRHYRVRLPSASTPWQVYKVTQPPGTVGGDARKLTSGDWVAEVRYAVALPPGNSTSYTVNMYNQAIGFNWTGRVDANGRVSAQSAASRGSSQGSPAGMPDTGHAQARTSPQSP